MQSFKKYESSLKIKPDNYIGLHNWGIVLLEYAKKKDGEEAEELMKRSFEKFIKSEEIIKGYSAYNLACIYSLVGEVKKSLFWLEKGLRLKSDPFRNHILTDSDLDNIKHSENFNKLINKYRPE